MPMPGRISDLERVTKPPQDPHATPEAQRAVVNFRFAPTICPERDREAG
jgi:hypothetical protein